jgi:hypothetical protein
VRLQGAAGESQEVPAGRLGKRFRPHERVATGRDARNAAIARSRSSSFPSKK